MIVNAANQGNRKEKKCSVRYTNSPDTTLIISIENGAILLENSKERRLITFAKSPYSHIPYSAIIYSNSQLRELQIIL
jgi:hypothetical protein